MSLILAVTASEVFVWIGYLLLALVCLMFMIIVHETGHFVAGRLLGFKIDEFSVGFGPAILKYTNKKSNVLFALRCIPLGGYCAFYGESDDEDKPKENSFNSHKPWKRIIVFIAGALFNFISAIIVISIFFMAYGDFMPKIATVFKLESGVEHVLKVDDVILEVNGKSLYSMTNQSAFVEALNSSGNKATLLVLRGEEKVELEIARQNYVFVGEDGKSEVKEGFGISYSFERYQFGFFNSIGRAFIFIFKVIGMLFATIGGIFTGALGVKESLGGTITAIGTIMQISRSGFDSIMYVVCVLSATLAVMNLLPLPALDGSKVVFTTIEWIRGKPINRKVENMIHVVGFFLLIGMTIVLDLIHFFG